MGSWTIAGRELTAVAVAVAVAEGSGQWAVPPEGGGVAQSLLLISVQIRTINMTNTSYNELPNPLKGKPSAAPLPTYICPANYLVFAVNKDGISTYAVYYVAPGKDPLRGLGRILELHPEYTYLGYKVMQLFNDGGRMCFEFNKCVFALEELKKHFTLPVNKAEQTELPL